MDLDDLMMEIVVDTQSAASEAGLIGPEIQAFDPSVWISLFIQLLNKFVAECGKEAVVSQVVRMGIFARTRLRMAMVDHTQGLSRREAQAMIKTVLGVAMRSTEAKIDALIAYGAK